MAPKERFFILKIDCAECGKTHRLKELDEDIIGRLHCTHCNSREMILRKQSVAEDQFRALRGKERVVLKEITKVRWSR